ncbi:hypothetical protein [Mycolicibacterium gadium]|uniref:FUSC family protein n=1 Tax=Mycolicibacterium gadium TaxID=1794 RepID=A0ABT6GWP3_MYCGU|nr:hypothetical protein [Mycolicibacterium gadium]MDG5485637.1 hypothetical protein [Mycolicibacterium gadium]
MTGPEDSQSTRPISVAELLARNGTIGAPPVGGRRRRRRGDTDSISVAELTGEIPIVTDRDIVERPVAEEPPAQQDVAEPVEVPVEQVEVVEPPELTSPAVSNGAVDHQDTDVVEAVEADSADEAVEADEADEADEAAKQDATDETDDDYADAVTDYAAHIQQRDSDADVDFFAPPRRSSYAPRRFGALVDAEEMSPDPEPVDGDTALDWSAPEIESEDDIDALDTVGDLEDDAKDSDRPRSNPRPVEGALFGGQTVADDIARRGTAPAPADIELDDPDRGIEAAQPTTMSSFMHGVWIVGQCVLAVAFGAGLFVAFDQLWKWNNIVALVLSVLVILGLVVGVRVVRKTEDIGSTLIAVAVGALVTLGPLALLQSG